MSKVAEDPYVNGIHNTDGGLELDWGKASCHFNRRRMAGSIFLVW